MKLSLSHPAIRLCLIAVAGLAPGSLPISTIWAQDSGEASVSDVAGDETSEASASEDDDAKITEEEILAGHSFHGEVFNEGPRQAAYLMGGTGAVEFPVTTDNETVQAFINQGVGQLHGFWYLEAERSFRQALTLDPECAIAYWGCAMANGSNEERAKEFIAKAMERVENVSPREKKYIEALSKYLNASTENDDAKRTRGMDYIKALEDIVLEHPEDLEAKAFLALSLWEGRRDNVPVVSYHAASALLDEIFAEHPTHPAHHYKIHLWDYRAPEKALASAAWCGPAAPRIAHMWHMPGHIYSRLKRYEDACWQQEASARTDHRNMMQDRVMPDEIHNFAHNNEWLIRNLLFVGRVSDALDLAKNMIELPQHPRYNVLSKRGSANYGRQRLFDVLWQYRLFAEAIDLAHSPYLEPTDDEDEQVKRLELLGTAYVLTQQGTEAQAILAELQERHLAIEAEMNQAVETKLAELRAAAAAPSETPAESTEAASGEGSPQPPTPVAAPEPEPTPVADEAAPADDEPKADEASNPDPQEEAEKKAREEAERPFRARLKKLEEARQTIEGFQAWQAGDFVKAHEQLKSQRSLDKAWVAEIQAQAGEVDQAIETLRKQVESRENEVLPLASLAHVLEMAGKTEEADQAFAQLRETSSSIDADQELFARLNPIRERLELPAAWVADRDRPDDLGPRPELGELGPFRWSPSPAPQWTLRDSADQPKQLADFQGQPVIVIFYLGYGCLHCAEQLDAFAPQTPVFKDAGIDIVAISTDDQEGIITGLKNYGKPMPIPLLADPQCDVFKAYRCYDTFEDQPLHGTFLIDGNGLVRWQDISYEPFMDHEFLLREAQRLLAQPQPTRSGGTGEISTLTDAP